MLLRWLAYVIIFMNAWEFVDAQTPWVAPLVPPKFPWGFVIQEHLRDLGPTNLRMVTNTPRHFVMADADGREYDWYLDTPFSVVLRVAGKPRYLYAVIKIPNMNYRCDRLEVVQKFTSGGR